MVSKVYQQGKREGVFGRDKVSCLSAFLQRTFVDFPPSLLHAHPFSFLPSLSSNDSTCVCNFFFELFFFSKIFYYSKFENNRRGYVVSTH